MKHGQIIRLKIEGQDMRFKEAQKRAEERGWKLERCSEASDIRWHCFKTGYLVTDSEGNQHRWAKLADFVCNCIEGNRWIDGFLRR